MYSLLNPNCHHQINLEKLNLKFHYPRPFEWNVIVKKVTLITSEGQ